MAWNTLLSGRRILPLTLCQISQKKVRHIRSIYNAAPSPTHQLSNNPPGIFLLKVIPLRYPTEDSFHPYTPWPLKNHWPVFVFEQLLLEHWTMTNKPGTWKLKEKSTINQYGNFFSNNIFMNIWQLQHLPLIHLFLLEIFGREGGGRLTPFPYISRMLLGRHQKYDSTPTLFYKQCLQSKNTIRPLTIQGDAGGVPAHQ